ncbi:MAG TPA: HAMP domain-containing sensor histidine kinase [Acidobacteriaceae bacterium]|nr:HAMP domain-containing sensor histidine kinase [Acidobacteriaceae bacterium]
MKSRSLTRQVVGIVFVAQVLCALLLATTAIFDEAHTHLRAFDVRLQGRSDSLLGAIQDAKDANSSVEVDPDELRLPKEDVFAVYNFGGSMLGSSARAPSELTVRGANGFRSVRFRGVRYRVLQREALRIIDRSKFGRAGLQRPVTIVYASPQRHVWHEIFEPLKLALISIFVAAALTMGSVSFFLRRALRPLSDLETAAGNISPPLLNFDPPASVLKIRELRPLADVLSEAVRGLREAFENEQRFVGNAAHELKTAIAVVRSSLQVLMLKRRTPDEYAAGLERAFQDNLRVEALVAQMLLLARVEDGSVGDVVPLDLSAAVRNVLAQLRPIAEEQQIVLKCDCPPGMMVRISPERADVLISNLVLNAIQHSQRGAQVEIGITRNHNREIALAVNDSGSGIGSEALPHIFERFYREDRSRSRNTGGTGLGLAICKSIADGAGGSIKVTSAPGEGTKATVVFGAVEPHRQLLPL